MAVALGAGAVRLSDPKPSHCSACHQGSDSQTRFVDFDAELDRGQFITTDETGTVLHRETLEDLHLCERCVREAAEALGVKPEFMRRLLAERDEALEKAERWMGYAKRLEDAMGKRPKIEAKRQGRRS